MGRHILWFKYCSIFLGLLFCAGTAYANSGLPMVVIVMPGMFVLLIPMIMIEAAILARYIQIEYEQAFMSAGLAKIISTTIGIPLAWIILIGIEMIAGHGATDYSHTWWRDLISVMLQAPWTTAVYAPCLSWKPFAGIALLMILFFFISWQIESFFVKITMTIHLHSKVSRGTLYANLAAYAFLELLIFIFLIISYGYE